MATVRISWLDFNINEDGFNIYKDTSPIDVSNLPSPIATLGPNIGSYDDANVTPGEIYHYRVGAFRGGEEKVGEELVTIAADFSIIYANKMTLNKADYSEIDIWSVKQDLDEDEKIFYLTSDPQGNIYTYTTGGNGHLGKHDSEGNEIYFFRENSLRELYFASDGYLYAGHGSRVSKRDPSDGSEVWLSPSVADNRVLGIGMNSNGDVVVMGSYRPYTMTTLDPSDGSIKGQWEEYIRISNLAVSEDDQDAYVLRTEEDPTTIQKFRNGDYPNIQIDISMYDQPRNLALKNGHIYLFTYNNNTNTTTVVKLKTSDQSEVWQSQVSNVRNPSYVTFGTSDDHLYIKSDREIVRVNMSTGEIRNIFSNINFGSGDFIVQSSY